MTIVVFPPPATVRLLLEVKLLSDLHAGSGLGGAGIDALLARDHRGRPLLRWSQIKGLLVEACRERYAAIRKENDGEVLIERLFGGEDSGGQARGVVIGRSLRLGTAGAKPAVVWSSTARQEDERAPLDDTLRRVEYLPSSAMLEGELRLPDSPSDVAVVRKLLNRVAQLGGDRSRGAGLVHVQVTEKEIEAPTLDPATAKKNGSGWHCLRVILQALEPVCLAATGEPGNLIPSHSYIGPAALKGMFARWALDSKLDTLADALLDGRIACTAAYPVPSECLDNLNDQNSVAVDAVPIPLSCQSQKPLGQDGTLPWWAGETKARTIKNTLERGEDHNEKLKRPGTHDYLYTSDGGATWQLFTCPMGTSMRNNTGSSLRRATKQDLFATEEVAADTGFVARLFVREETMPLANAMLSDLKERGRWLRVGRGGAPVAVVGWARIEQQSPALESVSTVEPDAALTLFVESDLILRAADLRFHTRLDTDAVRALLAEADVQQGLRDQVKVAKEVSELVLVHGWNFASGGPRLPAVAIRRGSIARLNCGATEN